MRVACCMTTATDTHTLRIYNTYCFFHGTMARRTRLNVTLHLHCLSCYFIPYTLSAVQEIPPFSIIVHACHSLKDIPSNWKADLTITLNYTTPGVILYCSTAVLTKVCRITSSINIFTEVSYLLLFSSRVLLVPAHRS
jgi:hypothetical protein